jgi:plasmid stabilization system protein ParE
MKIEYTNRAIADLRKVSADSRARFGAAVAAALEKRIRNVVDHVAAHPEAAPKGDGAAGRSCVPAAPLSV